MELKEKCFKILWQFFLILLITLSATGGYLKKKTDSGSELIENESLKSFPTNNDLVFKIKKTVSSTICNTTYHEKIEREHLDASKSLNDINMVSKHEVNNNLVSFIKEQDENSNSRNVLENCCGSNYNASDCSKNSKTMSSESLRNRSLLNVSVENNAHNIPSTKNNTNCLERELEKPIEDSPLKKSVNNSNSSPVKVITTNQTVSVKTSHCVNDVFTPSSKSINTDSQNIYKKRTDGLSEKPNSDLNNSQMSGVAPAIISNDGTGSKSDSQQMNYRVSTSVTESRSNQAKDTADSVMKDEQNCHLPSSVYGSPASSIEKVLIDRQESEKSEESESSFGKISFLQEILQKKSTEAVSYDSISRQLNSTQTGDGNRKIQQTDMSDSSSKVLNNVADLKIKNKFETSQAKLKLHIPEILSNDDSSSSVLSSESLKTVKIPKITSPQILEQHISKIISENAAIVETLDPKWSRRYCKQSSLSNSPIDSDAKKPVFPLKTNRSEDKLMLSSVTEGSKLHSALLGGSEIATLNTTQKTSSLRSPLPNDKIPQYSNLSSTVPSVNMYAKVICSVSEDELKGSAIKSLLSLKQGRYAKHKNSVYTDDIQSQHPQNPEGSIIKDLLLKSKLKDSSKVTAEVDDKVNSSFILDGNSLFYKTPLKCPNCCSEFSEKYGLDTHLSFCKSATKQLFSLRDNAERITFKQANAQKITDFQNNCQISENSNHSDVGIGTILKKQLLLPLSKSPPAKKRKVSDSVLNTSYHTEQSFGSANHYSETNKNILPTSLGNLDISPHRSRSHSVHLFGGEVQIMEGDKTKRIKIQTSIPGAFTPITNRFGDSFVIKKPELCEEFGGDKDVNSLSSVVVTIAQPVHNSGGTVHLPNCRSPSVSPVVTIANSISDGIVKYTKSDKLSSIDYSRITSHTELLKPFTHKEPPLLNLSNPSINFLPGPDSRLFCTTTTNLSVSTSVSKVDDFKPGSVVEEISPIAIKVPISPGNKPFYSPIFSNEERTFESTVCSMKCKDGQNNRIVPTVVFTPSSPTQPTTDSDTQSAISTSISDSNKKFLAATRPTSLPLKKKPFTMVGSTLISPETPRPKKTCIQLYLNGHAYTYLGLKCSTRSTYCCIYRPQPMFVLQETNPKLSMYSNWQVVPAKEELSGLTPGQMISYYCSKQRKELQSVSTTSKIGEPLIFTHSSYWTYRSTEHPENGKTTTETSTDKVEDNNMLVEENQVNMVYNSDFAHISLHIIAIYLH